METLPSAFAGDIAVCLCFVFFTHRLEDLHEAELAGTQRKTTRVKPISSGRVKISKLQITGEKVFQRDNKNT